MSVSLVLLPVVIAPAVAAVVGSVRASRQGGAPAETGAGASLSAALEADEARAEAEALRLGTRMRDDGLLAQALENYGCRSVTTGGTVDSAMEGRRIAFVRNEEGTFVAVFYGVPEERAREYVRAIDAEYARLVQGRAYQNLLARARERGLILESEEVLDDDSVVVTLQLAEEREGA